ncbi:MAG: hypothetical protein CBC46_10555 [Verrucomicrobiaceae bacterium TMED86]|nr:MAG: hypothetical protein CBC46_10555 [Verrucomicrobiaceae bacterium TMED86]
MNPGGWRFFQSGRAQDPSGCRVPVLLRQYFKMTATLLDFAHDPTSMECLIPLDLKEAPARLLKKYMGKEGYERFIAWNRPFQG